MDRYDAVIVGAGLAGLWCARSLAARGLRVLLADRKPSPWATVHTTGIFVRRTFEDFALPAACLGPPIRDVIVYSPSRKRLVLRSQRDEFRVADVRALYEHVHAECLRSGVSWLPRVRYAGLESDGPCTIVRFKRAESGRQIRVRTRYVVGADGAASAVARDLGLDVNRHWIVGLEHVYDEVPSTVPPTLHCFLDPRLAPGYLAWVVHDGAQAHVGVAGDARRFHPQRALAAFLASAGEVVELRRARFVERRGGRIPVGGVLRRIASERGLLVGDAAGAASPLTAGGLDACLRLSEYAARAMASGNVQAYDGARFRARFASRRWMRRVFEAAMTPASLEIAVAMLRAWPLRAFAEHLFFGRGSFPNLDITGRDKGTAETFLSIFRSGYSLGARP